MLFDLTSLTNQDMKRHAQSPKTFLFEILGKSPSIFYNVCSLENPHKMVISTSKTGKRFCKKCRREIKENEIFSQHFRVYLSGIRLLEGSTRTPSTLTTSSLSDTERIENWVIFNDDRFAKNPDPIFWVGQIIKVTANVESGSIINLTFPFKDSQIQNTKHLNQESIQEKNTKEPSSQDLFVYDSDDEEFLRDFLQLDIKSPSKKYIDCKYIDDTDIDATDVDAKYIDCKYIDDTDVTDDTDLIIEPIICTRDEFSRLFDSTSNQLISTQEMIELLANNLDIYPPSSG